MSSIRYCFDGTRISALSADSREVFSASISAPANAIAVALGAELPDLLADLADVAAAAHAADRVARRRSPATPGRELSAWQRDIRLSMSVRLPERWARPGVHDALVECLEFFTGDTWSIQFSQRPAAARRLVQSLLPFRAPTAVALFSGGLDSLAGLAAQALAPKHEKLALLTIGMNFRLQHLQRQLLRTLMAHSRVTVQPIVVPFRLSSVARLRALEENSQRSRGFLFGSLAAVVAMHLKAGDLLFFENGIGSLNLPLTPAQTGTQSTRSTNPLALGKLATFLRVLLESEFRIDLPCLFMTKASMCRILANSVLRSSATKTVSCDGFPARVAGPPHCGFCTSCLLRRQALWIAGFEEDQSPGRYRNDLLRDLTTTPSLQRLPLIDMTWQVERLRHSLESTQPWNALVEDFPQLAEIAEFLDSENFSTNGSREAVVGLYRDYCREWEHFPLGRALAKQAA